MELLLCLCLENSLPGSVPSAPGSGPLSVLTAHWLWLTPACWRIFPGTGDPWSRQREGQELQEPNPLLVPGQGQAFRSAHSREARDSFLMGPW